jgi:hypothetical protein
MTGVVVELALVTGERHVVSLPSHTGSLAAALDRLHDWIETDDGTWIQKRFVVAARVTTNEEGRGSDTELHRLDAAAGELADQA